MKKQFENYRRLARGLFSCSSLWAGPDHFVYVRGSGVFLPFVEEYKRFRYADIHAITMAPTSMYAWTSILCGAGAAASAALVFLPDYDPEGRIAMAVLFLPVLAVSLACFIMTLLRGPSCRCRVETSVGSVVIRPLTRTRQARRAVDAMSELVTGAQGTEFPGSDAASGEEGGAGPSGGDVSGGEGAAPPALPNVDRRIERSPFLLPTLAALAVFGVFWVVHAYASHWWPLVVLSVVDLLLFLGIAVSLVQQLRGFTPASILAVLWGALAQQFVVMGAAFVAYIYWSVETSMATTNTEIVSLGAIYAQAEETGAIHLFSMINGLASLALGLGGAVLVWRVRDRMQGIGKPPALPVEARAAGLTQEREAAGE